MTKIFKKMSSKKFKTIFKDFTNLESFFDDIRVKNIKPQALKNGSNNQDDKNTLNYQFDFNNVYELFPSQNGLFLFNVLKSDDFFLKDCDTFMFNVKVVNKLSISSFSEAILFEKVNPSLPAIISLYCSSESDLFIVP